MSVIQIPDIQYLPDYLTPAQSLDLFTELHKTISWQQGRIKLFGKSHLEPRLSAWIGEPDAIYTYAHKQMIPEPWPEVLDHLRQSLRRDFSQPFNSVLLNLYRDGHDYMGFHADNEAELGAEPVISSLSLGAERRFVFKHLATQQKYECVLESGSLLVMRGQTQQNWLHSLPRALRVKTPRINLTFRTILPPG